VADVAARAAQPTGDAALRAGRKIVIVMPARNAARTLADTVAAVPHEWVDEMILVDDSSSDGTVALARRLPLQVICHPHQVGYGGNQKTCYMEALRRGADVIVMLHPDGQYPPELVPTLVRPILAGEADLVLGSRLTDLRAARAGGMPRYKLVANLGLTAIENRVLGTGLSELHTGYRAYSRRLLETVPFLRNALDFSFDSELLMQAVHLGFRIAEVPARTTYGDDASSVGPLPATVYGLKTLAAAGRLVLHRRGVWRSRKFEP
jgi:glycosyltransferase involved in cell wall biosynthesis